MYIWHRGSETVASQIKSAVIPIKTFLANITKQDIARVPGTAVFLTRTEKDVPPVMSWHVRQNRSLHNQLFILNIATLPVPRVKANQHLVINEIAPSVWRATARYGFMEHPDVPKIMERARAHGCPVNLKDVTYYIGHETIIPRSGGKGLPKWIEASFAFMLRNALHRSEYFRLPPDAVVEIGRRVGI
jgi:KUP system potassium uptake protein